VVQKSGKSGPLVFVTLDHEIEADGDLKVQERQTIVYRGSAVGRGHRCDRGRPGRRPAAADRVFNLAPVPLFGADLQFAPDPLRSPLRHRSGRLSGASRARPATGHLVAPFGGPDGGARRAGSFRLPERLADFRPGRGCPCRWSSRRPATRPLDSARGRARGDAGAGRVVMSIATCIAPLTFVQAPSKWPGRDACWPAAMGPGPSMAPWWMSQSGSRRDRSCSGATLPVRHP